MDRTKSIVLNIGVAIGLINCLLSIVAFFHIVVLLAVEADEIFTEPSWYIFEIHFVLMFSIIWGLGSFWFYLLSTTKDYHKGVWIFLIIPVLVLSFVSIKLYYRIIEMISYERFYFRLPFFIYWIVFLFEVFTIIVTILVGLNLNRPRIIVSNGNSEINV